mmetsp:Transcript_2590/g.8062  ORF Transcript_2590/g.8062 Transcript_2590/m.8062 type:complete len:382 (+) Transcript_2590:65-1210(+)
MMVAYLVSVTEGAMRIASTPRGQMAAAVVVVLLTWAVLTKRVYVVVMWREGVSGGEEVEEVESSRVVSTKEARPEAASCESRREAPGKAQRAATQSRRRQSSSEGKKRPLSALEVHEASGTPPLDAASRVATRPGAYWSEPDSSGFRVRGPSYLMDKVKIGSPEPVFFLLDCDLLDLPQPTAHLTRYLEPRIDALWRDRVPEAPDKFTFVVQLQVPGPPHKAFVMYFGCPDRATIFESDTPFSRVARRFFVDKNSTPFSAAPELAALHKWRNNTFKLIPRCVNAPFVVKRAVGEVPTLLGNKLQQSYFGKRHYFEVDVNIASSRIAQYTVGLALNYSSVVICDLAFVLQGASPAELPEVLAGCMRIEHINMRDATNFAVHD